MSLKSFLFTMLHKKSWPIWRALTRPLRGLALVLFKILLRNKTYYYENYLGSNNRLLTFYKNLISPQRFLKKVFYRQVFPIPEFLSLGEPLPEIDCSNKATEILEKFRKDGAVVLPSAYVEIADHFIDRYNIRPQDLAPSDKEEGADECLTSIDQRILEFMADKLILTVFGLYYGRQPYFRSPANIIITYPSLDSKTSREWNVAQQSLPADWHYDTANMVQACLLLNDVSESDSHMVIAKGDHNSHRNTIWHTKDYYYSDEFVRDHYEIIHCCGPQGTLYLFDSNALHRLQVARNTLRVHVKIMFTLGNNMISRDCPDNPNYKISLKGLDLSKLTPLQRNAFKYII